MKIDTIIPIDQQAQVAEVGQRRLGKYQVLGTWDAARDITNFRTTLNGAPTVQPKDLEPAAVTTAIQLGKDRPAPGYVADEGNWGEQDDGKGLRRDFQRPPTSVRLAINPTLAPEGDE